jgi:hypothetical protein
MPTRRRKRHLRSCAECLWRKTPDRYCEECRMQRFAMVNLQVLLGLPHWLIEVLWESGSEGHLGMRRMAREKSA